MHECIRDPVGNPNRAALWHLPWMQCSVLSTYWLACCWLPADKQPEHLQFLAVAGVVPAISRDSSGSRLVAGLTPAPLSTMRGAHTTSLGEACSFPPSCKRSRQPARTCPRKGFPQHLLHRTVSAFRVNTAMPPPNLLPHHRAHFSPCLGAHYSGWDTSQNRASRQWYKNATQLPIIN